MWAHEKTMNSLICIAQITLFIYSNFLNGAQIDHFENGKIYNNRWYNPCDCGKANHFYGGANFEKIVGGDIIGPHKYPWMAILQINDTIICGGTIVSEKYVLTAAHCLQPGYKQDDMTVVVGKYDRCLSDTTTTILSVRKIVQHPDFNPKDFTADLMLLRLSMRLTFNKFVRPICLPAYDITKDVVSRYEGKFAMVIGWGKSDTKGKPTCIPNQLYVPVLDRKLCHEKTLTLFCAGYVEGGRDSCQGDSGGPLQILNSQERYVIIGIVSNGIGCALPHHPGLYTDVLKFLPWIWKNTKDSSSCW